MSATTIRLWLVRETDAARLYSTTPTDDAAREGRKIWIPRSIVEHTSKYGSEHQVKLPDWFIQKENL
jgi:hypothetical protein